MKINGKKYLDANDYTSISVVGTINENLRCNVRGKKREFSTIPSSYKISDDFDMNHDDVLTKQLLDYYLAYNKLESVKSKKLPKYNYLPGIEIKSTNDKYFVLSVPKDFKGGNKIISEILSKYYYDLSLLFYDDDVRRIDARFSKEVFEHRLLGNTLFLKLDSGAHEQFLKFVERKINLMDEYFYLYIINLRYSKHDCWFRIISGNVEIIFVGPSTYGKQINEIIKAHNESLDKFKTGRQLKMGGI